MSTKNSNDTIGNRTRDLPIYSTVPQPTAPPRAMQSCTRSSVFEENRRRTCCSGRQYADMHHCAMYMMELGKVHAFKYSDLDFATELQSEVRASIPRPTGTGSI